MKLIANGTMKPSLDFSRRAFLGGAALLLVTALVIAVRIIPSAPMFWNNILFNLLAALALGVIAFRIRQRGRLFMILPWVLALMTFCFAFGLNDQALAFRKQGMALHNVIVLMRACAAIELAAVLLVLSAVVFGPKPNLPPLTLLGRIVAALFLGVLGVFVSFFLGETLGDYVMFVGAGAYFLVVQYLLSRGNPKALRRDWPIILALDLALVAGAVLPFVYEPNKVANVEMVKLAILAVVCSIGGAILATLTAPRAMHL
jgi:hypothetical protein